MTKLKTATLACLLAGAFIGYANAKEFRATNWLQHNHPISTVGFDDWSKKIAEDTKGELTFKLFKDGVLLPAKSTLQGLSDGVAQVGFVSINYTPSEMPIADAIGNIGFFKPDPYVLAGAYTDFLMNDPDARAEVRKQNVVFGAGMSTPSYFFICRSPLKSAADLKGKRIRTPSFGFAKLVSHLGAVNVNMTGAEIYEGFDRGTLDCTVNDLSHITTGANLLDVAKGIIILPMSPSYTAGVHIYNRDFWKSLSEKDRRALLEADAWTLAAMEIAYVKQAETSQEAGRKKGIQMLEADESLQTAYRNWVNSGMGMAEDAAKMGIKEPQKILDRFRQYVDKWDAIIKGMSNRHSVEELTALYRKNLYDKIDISKYGLD